MSATGDAEFFQMLKKDIDYLKNGIERFEDLIPHTSAPVQDQWRLQAQARRNFTMELEILLEKAGHLFGKTGCGVENNTPSDSPLF